MRATRWPFLFIGPLIFFTAVSDIVVSAIYTNKKSTDKVRVWLGVSGVVSVPFGVVLLFLKGKTAFLWISFYNVFSVLWTVFGAISIEQALEGEKPRNFFNIYSISRASLNGLLLFVWALVTAMLILKVLRKNCLKYQKDEFDGVVPTQHQNGNVEVPPLPLHNEEMDYIIDTDPANIMYSPRLPIQWACSSDQRQHYLSADKPVSSARVDSEYEENIHRRVKSRLEAMRKTHIAELRYSPDNTDFDFGFL